MRLVAPTSIGSILARHLSIDAATAPAPLEIDGPRQEVRFGLVVYGGVSLAIYIYGVVYEFWRLIRASSGREQNEYSRLLEELGMRATVDIISGTSAGGINGILLAKALATGAGMDVVRSIWVDEGDILKLLRTPSEQDPRSLLRSDRFDELVRAGLDDMDRTGDGEPLVDVLDLFVPATRLRPWIREFQDYSGLVLETKEFRKLFRLKFRTIGFNPADLTLGYDFNDFAPSQNSRLAEVARATSAFPFAFEPRLIRAQGPSDARFGSDEPEATYFSDGGILDNKPFTEAIETISTRAAFWPVSRWLVSVEPDPGPRARQEAPGVEPEVVEVVGAALMGIPRSESISADLERLQAHRVRVERSEEVLRRVDRLVEQVLEDAAGGAIADVSEYVGLLGTSVYRSERRRAISSELVDRLLDCARLGSPMRPFVENALESHFRDDPASGLDRVDLAFERRRIYHLLSVVDRAPVSDGVKPACETVRARLWAAFERVDQIMWDALGPDSTAVTMLGGVTADDGAAVTEATESALSDVVAHLSEAREEVQAAVQMAVSEFDLAVQIAADSQQDLEWPGLTFVFANYELWDVFIVVVEHAGGVSNRDQIKHRHITPAAATYIRKPVDQKLAGDALGHFGGFLKKSWRLNDILWGRLDAGEIIVRTLLLEHGRTLTQAETEMRIRSVQEPIARAECQGLRERPDADYRLFLEQEYTIGAEDLADIAIQDRADLVLQGADVFRNMVRHLQRAEYGRDLRAGGLKVLFRTVDWMLGLVLFVMRWPLRAVFGRDIAVRRVVTLALSLAFGWAIVTLVLALLGIIPLDALAGTLGTLVGGAILVFISYVVLLGVAVRSGVAWPWRDDRADPT
jgi:predicted acylesterase/phospholipase RssA